MAIFRFMIVTFQFMVDDNTMKVMDVAEAKERRLIELDSRNAGRSQETVDDFTEMDWRVYQCSFHGPSEEPRMQPYKI